MTLVSLSLLLRLPSLVNNVDIDRLLCALFNAKTSTSSLLWPQLVSTETRLIASDKRLDSFGHLLDRLSVASLSAASTGKLSGSRLAAPVEFNSSGRRRVGQLICDSDDFVLRQFLWQRKPFIAPLLVLVDGVEVNGNEDDIVIDIAPD